MRGRTVLILSICYGVVFVVLFVAALMASYPARPTSAHTPARYCSTQGTPVVYEWRGNLYIDGHLFIPCRFLHLEQDA